ncbi:MAG: type II toxin-antitoxin system VapC family toxin [Chloroflexota bacterium]
MYLDASAAAKLLLDEPESPALRTYLGRRSSQASSALLRAELMRAARRSDIERVGEATAILARINLREVDDEVLVRAGEIAPHSLRTLDAIHIATATLLGPDLEAVVTYDRRMIEAARMYGLPVASPT